MVYTMLPLVPVPQPVTSTALDLVGKLFATDDNVKQAITINIQQQCLLSWDDHVTVRQMLNCQGDYMKWRSDVYYLFAIWHVYLSHNIVLSISVFVTLFLIHLGMIKSFRQNISIIFS